MTPDGTSSSSGTSSARPACPSSGPGPSRRVRRSSAPCSSRPASAMTRARPCASSRPKPRAAGAVDETIPGRRPRSTRIGGSTIDVVDDAGHRRPALAPRSSAAAAARPGAATPGAAGPRPTRSRTASRSSTTARSRSTARSCASSSRAPSKPGDAGRRRSRRTGEVKGLRFAGVKCTTDRRRGRAQERRHPRRDRRRADQERAAAARPLHQARHSSPASSSRAPAVASRSRCSYGSGRSLAEPLARLELLPRSTCAMTMRRCPQTHLPNAALGGAVAVGAGIFLSRIAGLVRERVIAHYLGLSPARRRVSRGAADPEPAAEPARRGRAVRIVHPGLRAAARRGPRRGCRAGRARRSARCSRCVASGVALLGVLAAGPARRSARPRLRRRRRASSPSTLVQITVPRHRAARDVGVVPRRAQQPPQVLPVVRLAGPVERRADRRGDRRGRPARGHDDDIAMWLAWGAVIGSRRSVPRPATDGASRLLRGVAPVARRRATRACARRCARSCPSLFGRGSVQISGVHRSGPRELPRRRRSSRRCRTRRRSISCPISLFGMAISAAELPEMSGATGDADARATHLQTRLASSLRRVVFLVVPSAVAFVAIGGPIVALLFQTGRFGADDTRHRVDHPRRLGDRPVAQHAGSPARLRVLRARRSRSRRCAPRSCASRSRRPRLRGALPLREAIGYDVRVAAMGLTAASSAAAWIEAAMLYFLLRAGSVRCRFPFGSRSARSVPRCSPVRSRSS